MVARQASLSITNSWSLLTLMSIELVMPSNHLILCRPLLLLPSIFPSIRVFSNESVLHIRWPKYWSFSFNISPSNEHPRLISFRMEWLDLLAVQGITILIYLKLNSKKILNLSLPFCESICVPQYKCVLWIKTGIYDPGVQWRAFIKDTLNTFTLSCAPLHYSSYLQYILFNIFSFRKKSLRRAKIKFSN